MPFNADNSLRPYTHSEVNAMNIRTFVGRGQEHGAETREIGQNTMKKQFLVNWASRFDFVTLCCGDVSQYTDGDGVTRLSRLLPDETFIAGEWYGYGRHPDFPEIVATKAETIKGANSPGTDDEDGFVEYQDALVDLYYSHVPYNSQQSDSDTRSSPEGEQVRYTYYQDSEGDAEVYQLPGGAMKYWREPGDPLITTTPPTPPHGSQVPTGVRIVRPVQQFNLVWEELPYEAFSNDSALYTRIFGSVEGQVSFLGCVNKSPFQGFEVGTVVLLKCKPTLLRSRTATGYRWRLEYTFLYSSIGHTWLYYPDPAGANAGWYNVNNAQFATADALKDSQSIVPGARDFSLLWSVN